MTDKDEKDLMEEFQERLRAFQVAVEQENMANQALLEARRRYTDATAQRSQAEGFLRDAMAALGLPGLGDWGDE